MGNGRSEEPVYTVPRVPRPLAVAWVCFHSVRCLWCTVWLGERGCWGCAARGAAGAPPPAPPHMAGANAQCAASDAERAMVEQWRSQSQMLSDMVRELQESEQAAWRAANEAREQAVREARALLVATDSSDPVATLRLELATERQANTRMQQLLRAQEEKISLLERMLVSARDAPPHNHNDSCSSNGGGAAATPSWLPRWFGAPANCSSSSTAADGGGSDEGGSVPEEVPWTRWLPLPRPSAAATPVKAPPAHHFAARTTAPTTPLAVAAAAAPHGPVASAGSGVGGADGTGVHVTEAAAAAAAAEATAAAPPPPLSPGAASRSSTPAGAAPAPPATPLPDGWTGAHTAARRLQHELRTEPRTRANAAGSGGAGATHVESFLSSFLHTVEAGGSVGGCARAGGALGGGAVASGGVAMGAAMGAAVGAAVGTAVTDTEAVEGAAGTPSRCDAHSSAAAVASSSTDASDMFAGVDLETAAASCAGRRGLQLQPCVVVALGSAQEDRVGYEPSPPVTTRVRDASTHRTAHGSGADLSSACSTVTLSSVPSSDRSAGF